MRPDTTNETGPTMKEVNLGKSKNERSVCKATQVESVQVISLIKSNNKNKVNIESESDPVEIKQAKSTSQQVTNKDKQNVNIKSESDPREEEQATSIDSNNKKSIDPHLEPIELTSESNQIKDSTAKPDQQDTVTTETESEATSVEKSAGDRLIPIEIPRIISWADLGLEPLDLGLEPSDFGLKPLHLTKVKIGPLTETGQWSEKRAPFQETEPRNKVVRVVEHFPGIDGETAEKVRNSSIISTQGALYLPQLFAQLVFCNDHQPRYQRKIAMLGDTQFHPSHPSMYNYNSTTVIHPSEMALYKNYKNE